MSEATLSTTPKPIDTIRILLVRILNAIRGGSGGTGGQGLTGLGSPEGVVSANPGTIYYATDTGGFYVKGSGSGSTGWVALIV